MSNATRYAQSAAIPTDHAISIRRMPLLPATSRMARAPADMASLPGKVTSQGYGAVGPTFACYTPRPNVPTGNRDGVREDRDRSVRTSRASWLLGAARPRTAARAAGHRARTRVEGPTATLGPLLPPHVLVSRELSRSTHARV